MHTSERATRPRQRSAATGGRAPRAGYLHRAGLTPKRKPCTNPEGFGLLKGMCRAPAGVGAGRSSGGARGLQTMSTSQRNQKGLNPRGHERGTRPGEPLREPAPPVTPCRRGLQGSKGPTGPQASPEPVTSLAGDNAADGTAASRLMEQPRAAFPNPALRRPDRAERDPGRQRGRAPGPGRTARPPPALRPVP